MCRARGAWGYLRLGALNLYYVHGRWYNPDTGLFLSPDENGEYRYGSGQDAVNKGWTRNDFINKLVGPARFLNNRRIATLYSQLHADHYTNIIAAMAAVGESGVYCNGNSDENCYKALGAIIAAARNRLGSCMVRPNCGIKYDEIPNPFDPLKVQLANILTADCATGCSQFRGLERWITVPGDKQGRCNFRQPGTCASLADPAYDRQFGIALEAAYDILSQGTNRPQLRQEVLDFVGTRRFFDTGTNGRNQCMIYRMTCICSTFDCRSQKNNPTYFWDVSVIAAGYLHPSQACQPEHLR